MLTIEGVSLSFSGIKALRDVSFTVPADSVTALIGPNGAGKSTIFNCVSRLVRPDAGTIAFEGTDVLERRASALVDLGVARTFQHAAPFDSLTVRDNVRTGLDAARRAGRESMSLDEILDLLDLGDLRDSATVSLPLGTRKRVELARALATAPRLLMLDEPASGLTHDEVGGMRDLLLSLKQRLRLTLLLVEHHMQMVMSMSNAVVVLASGSVIARGAPAEVQRDPAVVRAYLG